MSGFNMYSMYSYQAQDFQGTTDGKILCDLERLKHFESYKDFNDCVVRTFGDVPVGQEKKFEYANNVVVFVTRTDNRVLVGALKDNKQIFGRGWIAPKSDNLQATSK